LLRWSAPEHSFVAHEFPEQNVFSPVFDPTEHLKNSCEACTPFSGFEPRTRSPMEVREAPRTHRRRGTRTGVMPRKRWFSVVGRVARRLPRTAGSVASDRPDFPVPQSEDSDEMRLTQL